jgi:hypothetical protein
MIASVEGYLAQLGNLIVAPDSKILNHDPTVNYSPALI